MNHVDTTKTITHLSLCTGYEGIGLGLRRVLPNVREIAYVEIEAFAIANLANKIEKGWLDEAPIYTNLKTFPYRKFRGRVDILSGGFPCQGFSHAGNKKGVDDPRHLFPFIAKGITECRPRIVFLENVEGIISSKTHEGESVLQYVLRTLEEMGYRAEAGVFSASEVGAPHQRKRVFILGISNSEIERCRGWESGDDCDREWVQESSEEKQSNVWGEAEGCSRDNGELVNTDCDGLSKHTKAEEVSPKWRSETTTMSRSEGLSDTECQRGEVQATGQHSSEQMPGGSSQRWPSRPNQEQYEWEEPRVVKTEPKLGGTNDGSYCGLDTNRYRIDRLRSLGNGVVPDTAAKAFTTLTKRIIE